MDNSLGGGDAPGSGGAESSRAWGPDRRLRWLTLAIALAGVGWLALDRNAENRIVAAAVCLFGMAVFAVLTRVRVRLAADATGLSIRGPLHAWRVGWDEVASIATPLRGRRRSALLEIEIYDEPLGASLPGKAAAPAEPGSAPGRPLVTGAGSGRVPDARLMVFGSLELGADPAEVGRALRLLKP